MEMSDLTSRPVDFTQKKNRGIDWMGGWVGPRAGLGVFPHHHDISFMEWGHLLTRSGLTYPEVSSKVYHDSFCQLGSSISLPWVIYLEAFYLHVVLKR